MPSDSPICFLNEDALERLGLDEHDLFIVEGTSESLHQTINVLSPEFEQAFCAKFRVLPSVGTLGLTKRGIVVACPDFGTDNAGLEALAAAASALASSATASARRAEDAGAIGWLEALFRLSDSRNEKPL